MRKAILFSALICSCILYAAVASAETHSLTITPATQNVDNTALPLASIASHFIQCGVNGAVIGGPLDGSWAMPILTRSADWANGDWTCRAYTVLTNGTQSAASPVLAFKIPFPTTPKPSTLSIK